MTTTSRIFMLAAIRKFTNDNMPEGMYFDVFEIKLPSDEGGYKDYSAIVSVSTREEKNKLEKLYSDNDVSVAVILL